MPDRITPPLSSPIEGFRMERAQTFVLSNGISLHAINAGVQEVLGVEFIFHAGAWFEPKVGVSRFTNKMLIEGTRNHTALQISELISSTGSFLETEEGADRVGLILYTLPKHLAKVLPIVKEIFTEAIFPEKELETLKKREIQTYKLNSLKTGHIATRRFKQHIFGENHPYARTLTVDLINDICQADLKKYYDRFYASTNCDIIISGRFDHSHVDTINQHFGSEHWKQSSQIVAPQILSPSIKKSTEFIGMPDSVQSSIRMGRLMFNRMHPDFIKVYILNELFGGYFGSRLMKNIREDKGYTYGIYSRLLTFKQSGFLFIGAEVKPENVNRAIDEIKAEMLRLTTEPIPLHEVETLRNYMLGSFLNSINSPFDLASKFKVAHYQGVGYAHFDNLIEQIKTLPPSSLADSARFYLSPTLMTEVVAGLVGSQ